MHVFAHSLGSEIAMHAIDPLSDPDEHAADLTYQPEQKLNVDLVSLAGADLDQDHRLPVFGAGAGSIQLLWITIPERGATRDRVLILRKLTRGKPAVGDRAPRFSAKDLDDLVSNRRLVFDSREIPAGHAILDYYEGGRIRRLADAAVALRTGEPGRSELLGELDRLLKEPVQSERLRAALRSEDASQRLYALWRLEHAYCGAATHLVDGSAQALATLALRKPKDAEKLREKSRCVAFKNGYTLIPPLAAAPQ
jgi:hypothetical protein